MLFGHQWSRFLRHISLALVFGCSHSGAMSSTGRVRTISCHRRGNERDSAIGVAMIMVPLVCVCRVAVVWSHVVYRLSLFLWMRLSFICMYLCPTVRVSTVQ